MRSYNRSIVNQTHHSPVIIIITITAYHCSLFNVYQTVNACMLLCKSSMLFTLPVRILFFTYKIRYSHSHSQLVAQNYPHSHGNPMGMRTLIPIHTSKP